MIPFYPFWMVACLVMVIVGRRGAWRAPALALLGYVLMRGNMELLPQSVHEIVGGTLWLCIAAAMMYIRAWVPGFFFALSALTYPVLLIFGVRIEYLGLAPFIADAFAVLALLAMGGGLVGLGRNRSAAGNHAGSLDWLAAYSLGVAPR